MNVSLCDKVCPRATLPKGFAGGQRCKDLTGARGDVGRAGFLWRRSGYRMLCVLVRRQQGFGLVLARNKKWEEAQEGRDLQRDTMNSMCVLCRENEPTMAFMPCGHRGVYERCDDFISFNGGSALSTCPVYGQDVEEMKRIFGN